MRKAPLFWAVMTLLLGLFIAQQILPERENSEMEKRVLATRPSLSLSAMAGSQWADSFEAFVADQLPLRDVFVSAYAEFQALTGHRLINGVILGRDGWMFSRTDSLTERNVQLNAQALAELSALTGVPAYLLAVPSAAEVYREKAPAGAPLAREEELIAAAAREAPLIPLLPALRQAREEQPLCYRSDHHWTLAGARLGYLAACQALGLSPLPPGKTEDAPGFYGTFYARCPRPGFQPDDFSFDVGEGLCLLIDGQEMDGLVDREQLKRPDRYAALLYGNHGLVELINPAVETGTLFVLKDSYANALLPSLARHYHRIVAVDARYFSGNVVDTLNECKGDAVLCVCGVTSLGFGREFALLEGL